ncbi:MAG TPA: GNAT family N-acetyltransferase [Microlunatus sp.]
MTPTVVVITGPVGSGKSTSMVALGELLEREKESVAMIDMDSLRALLPADQLDPFRTRLGIDNLRAVWPQFARRGARWLLLADVVEHPEQRAVYEDTVPEATVIIVRLDVPIDRIRDQLLGREVGASLDWHLKRSVELRSVMIERGIGDVVVPIDGHKPPEVASLILDAVQHHLRSVRADSERDPDDALAITDFLEDPDQSAVIDFLAQWATGSHQAALDHIADHATGQGTTLVARMQQTVAGLVSLRWTSRNPLFAERGIPLVHQLSVRPSYRRRGIATELLNAAEHLVAESGRDTIGITVGLLDQYGPAQRLYAKRGYLPDGRGACQGRIPTREGQKVEVDGLILWLTKDLERDVTTPGLGAAKDEPLDPPSFVRTASPRDVP